MNLKQAMTAVEQGHKVRGSDFVANTWVNAGGGTNSVFFTYTELEAMEWEIYEERSMYREEVIKIFNASANRARQAMNNIFKEALEDIEKLKIR